MKKLKIVLAGLMVAVLALVAMPGVAEAKRCYNETENKYVSVGKNESCPGGYIEQKVETSILRQDLDIDGLLQMILTILTYGLGAAAVLGVIIVGIQYMTARDNESQATAAKKRLYEVIIGLVAWALMFTVLNWLIPGGVHWPGA